MLIIKLRCTTLFPEKFFMRFKLFLPILLAGLLLLNCGGDQENPEHSAQQEDREDFVQLTISILDSYGDPITPALLQVFPAESGSDGEPIGSFYADDDGIAEGWFDKNNPVVLKISPAWHQPVEMFIPSYTMDQLSVEVIPAALHKKEEPRPSIIGDFDYFDSFSSVEMQINDNGLWVGTIETDQPKIRYQLSGFAHKGNNHGTMGDLQSDSSLSGIVSEMEHDGSGSVEIEFDPARFPSANQRAEISFNKDVPVVTRGIAKLYAAMKEQASLADLYKDDDERLATFFSDYLDHTARINDSFEHRSVDLAHRITKARFLKTIQQDDRWVDQLLNDLESASETWLFYTLALKITPDMNS